MADRRTKSEDEPTGAAEAEPTEAEPTDAEPTDAEPGFANRAARRARGKGSQPPKAAGKVEPHGRRGPAQSPRSWANRRSG